MSAPRSLSTSETQQRQTAAWEAYQALYMATKREPGLASNPYWKALWEAVYARFRAEFEAGQ